ncbi:MAG TPA: O-antigen ligase family protein [Stellaceae bacterium]|nr:O-antigen ligase family protein [Stellaceae bacterium]
MSTPPLAIEQAPARWPEYGLDACVFLLLPVLVLTPRGAAPLAAIAGLLGLALALPAGLTIWRKLVVPAVLLGALIAWGLVSSLWAVDPERTLEMAVRLAALFAAALGLAAAAEALAAPRRLLCWLAAGLAVAIVLAAVQFFTQGWLTNGFSKRVFIAPALNQVENALALLLLPLTALLIERRRPWLAALVAVAMALTLFDLVGTSAKAGIAAGVAVAALLYLARRLIARLAAIVSVVAILTAPLTFPALTEVPAVHDWAAGYWKFSARHRLEIWWFTGNRIAERPMLGWGLDSSRAIPGGSDPTPEGPPWLPLHPHNGALQIWLELGLPGALLFAGFIARLWLSLARAPWPRLFAAAAGGSLCASQTIGLAAYGLWEEWWIGTQFLMLFLILVMGRLVTQPIPETPRGSIS